MAKNTSVIEINGTKYILSFGLEFLRLLNEKYTMTQEGFELSIGIPKAMTELQFGNAIMVADMIKFATATLHNPPTDTEIEEYVYEQLEDENTTLFDDFFALLQKAPGAKRMLKLTENQIDKKSQKETIAK